MLTPLRKKIKHKQILFADYWEQRSPLSCYQMGVGPALSQAPSGQPDLSDLYKPVVMAAVDSTAVSTGSTHLYWKSF